MSSKNQVSESGSAALLVDESGDTERNVASGSSGAGKKRGKTPTEISAKKKKPKLDIVDELNSVGKLQFIKLSELQEGEPYPIQCFKFVNTKFGRSLAVEINDGEQDQSVFLPKRYSDMYDDDDLDRLMTSQLALIYNGTKLMKNGMECHDVEFQKWKNVKK